MASDRVDVAGVHLMSRSGSSKEYLIPRILDVGSLCAANRGLIDNTTNVFSRLFTESHVLCPRQALTERECKVIAHLIQCKHDK
jgi:hypothetical protein